MGLFLFIGIMHAKSLNSNEIVPDLKNYNIISRNIATCSIVGIHQPFLKLQQQHVHIVYFALLNFDDVPRKDMK